MSDRDLATMFSSVTRMVDDGCFVKPRLHAYLYGSEFPDRYSVEFRGEDAVRKPDGLFHPSTHPLWPARRLFYYLTEPDKIVPEPLGYMGTLSVTVGKAMHSFISVCLQDMGLALTPERLLAEGWELTDDGEAKIHDPVTGAAGSMDEILDVSDWDRFVGDRCHFEYKTTSKAIDRVDDLDLEWFMEKHPGYYAQAQEYLRVSGLSGTILLMMKMGYPWDLREFHIPYNPQFAEDVAEKYLTVRRDAGLKVPPPPCCTPGSPESKTCEARTVCPVGAR